MQNQFSFPKQDFITYPWKAKKIAEFFAKVAEFYGEIGGQTSPRPGNSDHTYKLWTEFK
jgi:hypothetical protein